MGEESAVIHLITTTSTDLATRVGISHEWQLPHLMPHLVATGGVISLASHSAQLLVLISLLTVTALMVSLMAMLVSLFILAASLRLLEASLIKALPLLLATPFAHLVPEAFLEARQPHAHQD